MITLKVCGLTNVDDASACAASGVHALGVRLDGPPRGSAWALAASIVEAVGDRTLVVGVVDARATDDELDGLKRATGVGCLQFEGPVARDRLERFLPHAYVALPLAALEREPAALASDYVMALADELPGPNDRAGWAALRALARAKRLALSAPFTAASARETLRRLRPFCLDLRSPPPGAGRLDRRLVEALLDVVREPRPEPPGG